MDFWDYLTFSTMMTIRDYYREEYARKQRAKDFYQECKEEIGSNASELFTVVSGAAQQANPNYVPDEIVQGGVLLPVYAFANVLKCQGGQPTPEQNSLLDIYFQTMSVGFPKALFIVGLRMQNDASRKLHEIVGISDSYVGSFWKAFFKSIYITKSDERILSKVSELYAAIVMRFSILGQPQSQAALPICEEFIKALHIQVIECRKLPENDIDFIGEVSFLEHKKRMDKLAMSLLYEVGDQDEIELDELLPYFYTAILYDLIQLTSRTTYDKAGILDYAIHLSAIHTDLSGYDVYKHMEDRDDLFTLLDPLPHTIFTIVLSLAQRANKRSEGPRFISECTGFLAGIETQLSKEYPFSGFGNLARKYILDKSQALLDAMR